MMNELYRPNPDELLVQAQAEFAQKKRGRLKIFLGYAAGVGKTFAMLEAAQQRQEQGIDVIVGYIETHGRKETETKLAGLEIAQRRFANYHGAELSEMDLDKIIHRNPQLVLVDELAHTNIPDARHPKRYMDVEEILSQGIDVYTTVNIQHFESMNDVVRQITGVTVKETVPDRLLDEASEIEVIDLPPDELIQRLKEGKVYIPDQAARAIEKFFRKGNLTALREMSLRRAAERVDDQMRSYMRAEAIAGPWPAGDRILVCISSHPLGERLVRTGRRLSDDLGAEWIVAYVETPGHMQMPAANQDRINHNLNLAEQLGARVERLAGQSVAETVLDYARRNNVTKIIAGKPLRSRWYEILRGGSVVDQIIRQSGSIDIFVISETNEKSSHQANPPVSLHNRLAYMQAILLVALITLINLLIRSKLEPTNLVMFYLAIVVLAAIFLGRGPSILASFLSVLAFDFFFILPYYSFAVSDTEYIVTFIGFMIVGLVISSSASLLRNQVDQLKRRERNARASNALSKELTGAVDLQRVLDVVIQSLAQNFQCEVVILLPHEQDLVLQAGTPGLTLDENELAVAKWAFRNSQTAGEGTQTLNACKIRFLPLITVQKIVGVLGIKLPEKSQKLSHDDYLLLENFTNLAALAVERAQFAEKVSQAESLRATERLQSALLNSISHELKTPLASIMGVLTSLEVDEGESQAAMKMDLATRSELIRSAAGQTKYLNRLVGNLLDMTRIQSGAVHLKRSPTDIQDLCGAVIHQMGERLHNHQVRVSLPENLPPIAIDAVLIGQALANLLDNAAKFSPPGTQITIEGELLSAELRITIKDQGPGVAPDELERIFDKFYRGKSAHNSGGTGLGLSICSGIIEAHQGKIWAANLPEGGLMVTISLPLDETLRNGERQ